MTIGETVLERTPRGQIGEYRHNGSNDALLRDSVTTAVKGYLEQLDGQLGNDVYQMVLAEVEAPLLTQIMQYTRNNQTKASRMLGLNRGTLRKKLKQYGLLDNNGA
jgi:Fis family transcriptional regulator